MLNAKLFSRLLLTALVLTPSCVRHNHGVMQKIKHDNPIFIAMPQSSFTFENIAPELYQALAGQFRRKGYYLVDKAHVAHYSLETVINNLSSSRRYISPDVLLFNYSLKLDVTCLLYDGAGGLIKEKKFSTSTLISKAKNPIMNSSFLEFETKRLLRSLVPQVELYFRLFLLR